MNLQIFKNKFDEFMNIRNISLPIIAEYIYLRKSIMRNPINDQNIRSYIISDELSLF